MKKKGAKKKPAQVIRKKGKSRMAFPPSKVSAEKKKVRTPHAQPPRKPSAPAEVVKITGSHSESKIYGRVQGLPYSYNETKLVLLVRDPYTLYSFWDFSADTWNWFQGFSRKQRGVRSVLRVHNLNQGTTHDLDAGLEAKNWYIHAHLPDTSFEAELGLVEPSGKFHSIVRSNRVKTPRDAPSEVVDGDWAGDDAEEIYRLSGGGKTGYGSPMFSPVKRPQI